MRSLVIAFMAVAFIASAPLSADQRGGGRQGGGGPPAGAGAGQRGPQTAAPKHPDVRRGDQNAERLQNRARDLERHAANGDSVQTMTRDRDRIREQLQDMEKAHQQWRDGLGEQDRLRLRDQLREMDQQRERLRTHFQDLDAVLSAPSPDRARIRDLAQQIAQESHTWRNAWRTAAGEPPAVSR